MPDSLATIHRALIHDGGPIYHEFISDALIKEPWNAASSLVFFIPAIYWVWKLRGEYKENLIIVALLPLLFLNGLGSTLFHAFRTSPFFLLLDWLPAALLSLVLSTYLWSKLLTKWYWGLLVVIGFYALSILGFLAFLEFGDNEDLGINVSYFFTGMCYLVPIVMVLSKTNWYKLRLVILSFVLLGLALVCRATDYPTPNPFPELMPQGTHFMWHVFSAFAVFTMGYYVYFINKFNIRDRSTYPGEARKGD